QPFMTGDFILKVHAQWRRRKAERLIFRVNLVHRIPGWIISIPIWPRDGSVCWHLKCEVRVIVFAGGDRNVFCMYTPQPAFRWNKSSAPNRKPILFRSVV